MPVTMSSNLPYSLQIMKHPVGLAEAPKEVAHSVRKEDVPARSFKPDFDISNVTAMGQLAPHRYTVVFLN